MVWLGGAAILFVALAFVANGIARRSLMALSVNEKARLVDVAASTSRVWSVLFLALIVGWITSAYRAPQRYFPTVSGVVMVSFMLLASTAAYSTYGRLRKAQLPAGYLRSFVIGRGLRLASGLILFAALFAYILAA